MPPRILVVEDEPSIADNILYALKTEGFETIWCATAKQALTAQTEASPSLIVLDVGLPDANGFDLCRQLRSSSTVPIIFVTARKDEIDRVVGLEIGADDYIVKPFSPRELSARVKAVLRRTAASQETPTASISTQPHFSIDTERREIRYHTQLLTLSRYEYRLLIVLLDHPGRVFSRDELMERVWDEPGSSMDRTVDAHIKMLRAKLHTIAPESDPIRTHRGVGYAMAES